MNLSRHISFLYTIAASCTEDNTREFFNVQRKERSNLSLYFLRIYFLSIFYKIANNIFLVPPTLNAFTVDSHLRLGQRVSMLCSATDGDLPMRITWYRNEIPLSGGSSSGMGRDNRRSGSEGISITEIGDYESVLRIDNLRPEHNANFTCVAENDGGIAQHSQVLRVKGTKFE